jgi:nucleotide-binding universal stress UspA family protein
MPTTGEPAPGPFDVEERDRRSNIMPIIDHIICPVYISSTARPLIEFASMWARWYDAELHVVHAVAPPRVMGDPLGGAVLATRPRPWQEIQAELRRIVPDTVVGTRRWHLDVVEASPVEAILAAARKRPHSMVIMATHGRGGLDRIVHGSVTAAVTHHAPCGVLVLPARLADSHEPLPPCERILCALDFLPSSRHALQHAIQLAEQAGARLEVVHVLETAGDAEALALRHFSVPEYHNARFHEAMGELQRSIPERARRWCDIQETVVTGHPAFALLRAAEEAQADLIVIGAGDRYHMRSMWLGGVAEGLLRLAHAPVLIVPAVVAGAAVDATRTEYTTQPATAS